MESFIKYFAHPQLNDVVNFIYEVKMDNRPYLEERIIPDGNFHLVFNFGSPIYTRIENEYVKAPDIYLVCLYEKSFSVKINPEVSVMSVVFKPGRMRKLTNLPMKDLVSKIVPAKIVFGERIESTFSMLAKAESSMEKIDLINDLLLSSLCYQNKEQLLVDVAIDKIIKFNGKVNVSSLLQSIKINDRYFRRLFSEQTGMSPKDFQEIVKVRNAIKLMVERNMSVSDVCYHLDYCDLSHFNHAFKSIVGVSPTVFLKEHNEINSMYYSRT